MTRTGVTMQTSAKHAKLLSVYDWLQVDRLERGLKSKEVILACGDLAVWSAYIDRSLNETSGFSMSFAGI